MRCKNCGCDLPPGANFCPQCQKAVSESLRFSDKIKQFPPIVKIAVGLIFGVAVIGIVLLIFLPGKLNNNTIAPDPSPHSATQENRSLYSDTQETHSSDSVTQETEPAQQADEERIIYDKNDIKVVFLGFDDTGVMPKFKFRVENHSKYDIYIDSDNVSLNDYMITTSLLMKVAAGKFAIDEMVMFNSEFDKNDIKTLEKLEFVLKIDEADNYGESPIDDSVDISITF